MGKDDFSLLTVSQLKENLKSKGLPVSGNKAELVSRLNATPKPIESTASKPETKSTESSKQGVTPFFKALAAGGIGAVEIDRWKAAKYGMAAFMILAIIISLNSNTWYTLSHSATTDDGGLSTPISTATVEYDLGYGLNDIEFNEQWSGYIKISNTQVIEYSECYEEEEAQCVKMSSAGTIMQISLWLSLLTISALLIISIMRGFGKLETGFIDKNYSKIDFWGWSVSSLVLILGLMVYASISFTFDTSYIFGGEEVSNGLGSTWWMMFILSSIFMAIVYNSKTMQIIEFVKSKFD
jgi:hypothetical protein